MMLRYTFLFWLVLLGNVSFGQQTLVPEAQNDTIYLNCPECALTVRDMFVFKGQQWEPLAGPGQGMTNLLLWRYFDNFLGKHTYYHKQMLTEPSMLLYDEVDSLERLSLHVVLEGRDSMGNEVIAMLLLAGLTKAQFNNAPLTGVFEKDPDAEGRFYAFIRVRQSDKEDWKAYDSLDGKFDLLYFDPRKKEITGHFEMDGNCIGWHKRSWFTGGHFSNVPH